MKLWKILTYFVVIFLGLFYASGFGHSFIVNSVGYADEHNHNIPDHEIHHSEDIVGRGNLITHNEIECPLNTEYPTYLVYDQKGIPDRKYALHRQKVFDKQRFFFSDTIRLLL